ncbi:MAG: hypothetical protein PHQ98_04540, partial [Candidatus ainarchaeum sp.]|nr:hypothetical protein [Candidatus ainarchaeum sp.]
PWAKMSRREKLQVRQKHSTLALTEKFLSINQFLKRIENGQVSRYDLFQFLTKTSFFNEYCRVNVDHLLHSPDLKLFLKSNKSDFLKLSKKAQFDFFRVFFEANASDKEVVELAKGAAFEILQSELFKIKKPFEKKLVNYLKERKIPFDKTVFERTLSMISSNNQLIDINTQNINLAFFEASYLKIAKLSRRAELGFNKDMNSIMRDSFPDVRLTTNQRKSIKRWAKQDMINFSILNRITKTGVKLKDGVFVAPNNVMGKIDSHYASLPDRIKEQFKSYVPISKTIRRSNQNGNGQNRKGNREERMQDYQRKQAEEVKKEKELEIQLNRKVSAKQLVGEEFNTTRYCLTEISKSNKRTAEVISDLLKKRLISAESIKKLFISPLAQKVFIAALDNRFTNEFGVHQIESLARGLAFIGAKVPKERHAINAFRNQKENRADNIIRWLDKQGLIETQHRNGACLGLSRK